MTAHNKAQQAVYAALDELNRQRPADRQVPKAGDTLLTGTSGILDSLGLVTFVVALEQKIEDILGATVPLTDDSLLGDPNGPFRSVETLVAYIDRRAGGATDAR